MYAVEFETVIKDNKIEIPEVYHGRLQQQVRVILLGEALPTAVLDQNPDELVPRSIMDVLAEAPGQRIFRTAADVEAYLQEERESWDR